MKDKGFTLLEVMVSLAIVGGLLVTLIYSLNYNLGIAGRHEFITTATILARAKMAEYEKTPAEAKGSFPDPFSSYRYTVGVKDSPYPGISEMDVTVERNGEKVELSEMVAKKQ
jgi:prepilin-type N-terminal cleavage/methylation domain-containing protein